MLLPCFGNQCITSPWLDATPCLYPSEWQMMFLLGQTVLLAKVGTKFNGLTVHLLKIGVVRKTVLADFKADMRVVGAATACHPR